MLNELPRVRVGSPVCVPINSEVDLILARQQSRSVATQLNFSTADLALIATTIFELAQNIITYAGSGEIVLQPIHNDGSIGLEIVATDEGPGIQNLAQAVQDGFSTSGGLGLGLPGVRRLMDEFDITSHPGTGTTVRVAKWRR